MTERSPRIKRYMSTDVQTIGDEQPMSVAHRLMRERKVHHLPVLHKGKLIGIVTDRDLRLLETVQDADPVKVAVSEAMSADVYTIGPDAELDQVVGAMAANRCGSAVVVDHGQIVGIFTTADACGAFAELLSTRLAGVSRSSAT